MCTCLWFFASRRVIWTSVYLFGERTVWTFYKILHSNGSTMQFLQNAKYGNVVQSPKGIQTPSFIASFETIQLQICVCTEIRGVTYSYKREYVPASNSMEITFNTNHELFFWYSQEKFSGMNQTRELNVTYSWKSQLSMFYTVWESANSFHNMQF